MNVSKSIKLIPKITLRSVVKTFFLFIFFVSFAQSIIAQTNSAKELAGLWEAKNRFGPDIRGTLLIRQSGNEWKAEIAGYIVSVKLSGEAATFELPDGKGSFIGKFDARRTRITGHWIQPRTIANGTPYASPVALTKNEQNIWSGEVSPLGDEFTFYLMINPREDGTVGAFLKNPERNLGRFIRIDHVEREGEAIKLFAANSATTKGRLLAEGKFDTENQIMTVYFPSRGGTYDFRHIGVNESSDFYPRGRPTGTYTYAPPLSLNDGWPTASLEDVGISRAGIEKFIQMIIDTPINSVGSQEVHGVLIARHGKLVLEEYFHGEHRDKPHDTRSAAKSLTATLVGAATKAGIPIDAATPVYQTMNGSVLPADLDPRKRALKVENLLLQNSGLDCDDADDNSPGNEQNMLDQTEQPDYYKYTLALKMIRQPGEKSVYCSVQANLLGGVLQRTSKQSLPVLFHNLIAEPLQIKKYYMYLTPAGDAYMGGGVRFLPRDFMKLGQLYLNGGTWNGRKVLAPEWVKRATSPLTKMGNRDYGYLWYIDDRPYKGRTVRTFMAGGNGGQIVMVVPELDLVIAFYGGNYSDSALFIPQNVYVPQYILPAVEK